MTFSTLRNALIRSTVGAFLTLSSVALGALPNGAACALDGDCTSNHCADGVCCNSACTGVCEACVAAKKQSAKETGVCGPNRAGTDPDDECAPEDRTTCGRTGNCDGLASACAQWPQGTPCHAVVDTQCQCDSVTGSICSGNGVCYDETTPKTCGNGDYHCIRDDGKTGSCVAPGAGACASPCTTDGACNVGFVCLGGACAAKRPDGAGCAVGGDCASSHCVDGFCCNTACNRQCEACDQTGLEGVCSQVSGSPIGSRPACSGAAPCAGVCGGRRDGCDYPGSAAECGGAACVGDSLKLASTCDGTGQCAAGLVKDCGAYSCETGSNQCFTECTTSAQCAAGGQCDTTTGRGTCNAAEPTCAGPWSVKAVDGTVQTCGGYRCVAGSCQARCSSASDCASGYGCDASSRCAVLADAAPNAPSGAGGVASSGGSGGSAGEPDAGMNTGGTPGPTASAGDDSGCGCRLGPSKVDFRCAWLVLAALVLARRRRVVP